MNKLKQELQSIISGDVQNSARIRDEFSHDASMFEVRPDVVVSPKDSLDIQSVVSYVTRNKLKHPELAITARSAGTDMSGAAIGESIVLNMRKYFTKIHHVDSHTAHVQPGVLYRDFEPETLKHGALLPPFPASRDLCSVGGMVNNNSGGEKSLEFGKTEKYVTELSVVFADGKEYIVKPLTKAELDKKMQQKNFEGRIYREVFDLVDSNYNGIKAAKPNVSKDSTGYHLWNIWDRKTEVFDMTQAIIGAQGTLGIVTDIKFRLVKAPKHTGSLIIFLNHMDNLGDVINKALKHKPATFEGFDNHTLMLSFKLFFYFFKTLGVPGTIKLALQLIPSLIGFRRGIPKMVLIVQFSGDTFEEVARKVHDLREDMRVFGHDALFEEDENEIKERKFFIMRRESFNLLRKTVKDKHTAPFIDDFVVPPKHLPEFLPELRKIIKKYKLLATLQGHFGDGNFHVIPLMKIEDPLERIKIQPVMIEVNELVMKYGGSLSGEHNDGMSRGPWLHQMYSQEIIDHFKRLKNIFDPNNIFNPKKKTDADWDYSMKHIREHF